MESIKIENTSFVKDFAKDMTLDKFKEVCKNHKITNIEKAFVICGGKTKSKK